MRSSCGSGVHSSDPASFSCCGAFVLRVLLLCYRSLVMWARVQFNLASNASLSFEKVRDSQFQGCHFRCSMPRTISKRGATWALRCFRVHTAAMLVCP